MPSALFITASGTGLGKTLFTAALTWQLRQQGKAIRAYKPFISGFDMAALAQSDTGILLAAQGEALTQENANRISPWRFAAPVSPHIAVAQEGSSVDALAIEVFCQQAANYEGGTLIEGAGGLLSPLVQGFTQADLLQRLDIPAVLVGGTYLGAISHTLAAAEVLQSRGITLAAIVISESAESGATPEQTRASVASHLPQAVEVFTLPRISPTNIRPLWQQLPPLDGIWTHGTQT